MSLALNNCILIDFIHICKKKKLFSILPTVLGNIIIQNRYEFIGIMHSNYNTCENNVIRCSKIVYNSRIDK